MLDAIKQALVLATARIISVWLPVFVSAAILYVLVKISHKRLSHAFKTVAAEADSFSKKKRNSLSVNFLGGVVLLVAFLFVVVDTLALHSLLMIEGKTPAEQDTLIVELFALLLMFFIGCPVATKYFDPGT